MQSKSTFFKIIKLVKKYIHLFILSLLFALCSVALTLYLPILFGRAIDCISGSGVDFGSMLPILLLAAAIAGITALLQWLMNYCSNKITYSVIRDIRNEAFMKIQSLPLSYLDAHQTGETLSRVISDADIFAEGLLLGFTQFFSGVMTDNIYDLAEF